MVQHPVLLMGILNVTPDSFFDKGIHFSIESAVQRACLIAQEGADILDIGGASSRPGALAVSEEEELRRVIPIIEELAPQLCIPISIDTCTPRVAALAVEKGARLINDITGFCNPSMREVAASCSADLCVMHMQGTPATMQLNPFYPEGVVEHILRFFDQQIESLIEMGIDSSRIILDPGIGFGKTFEHNLSVIAAIDQLKRFGLRLLIGISRKKVLQQMLNKPASDLLFGTLALHSHCVHKGVDIIRVHDVKEHRDMLDVFSYIPNASQKLARW